MAVAGDQELHDHLAEMHQLDDDPGTATAVEHLRSTRDGFGGRPALAAVALDAVPAMRFYDQDSEDRRWHPVSVGIGGILITVLVAFAVLML